MAASDEDGDEDDAGGAVGGELTDTEPQPAAITAQAIHQLSERITTSTCDQSLPPAQTPEEIERRQTGREKPLPG